MKKRYLIIPLCISVGIVLVADIPLVVLGIRTNNLYKDYSYLKDDENYSSKVEVNGVNLVTQHISCGYASIEMLSDYYGNKVTEDDLSAKNNGNITTSSTGGFLNEINASITNKNYVLKSYLTNDELLKEIHDSLSNSNPVPIEWAAKYDNQWTFHFSVVTGLDIKNDCVTIYNPYGYIENISVSSFVDRTTFTAYDRMPFYYGYRFTFGVFDINAIFVVK